MDSSTYSWNQDIDPDDNKSEYGYTSPRRKKYEHSYMLSHKEKRHQYYLKNKTSYRKRGRQWLQNPVNRLKQRMATAIWTLNNRAKTERRKRSLRIYIDLLEQKIERLVSENVNNGLL